MFGPKLGNVFKSRWQALWWAGTILLTAYCTVPSPEQTEREQKKHEQQQQQQAAKHTNPWAKDAG